MWKANKQMLYYENVFTYEYRTCMFRARVFASSVDTQTVQKCNIWKENVALFSAEQKKLHEPTESACTDFADTWMQNKKKTNKQTNLAWARMNTWKSDDAKGMQYECGVLPHHNDIHIETNNNKTTNP